MKLSKQGLKNDLEARRGGFTLAETVVSIAIAMFAIVGLMTGFVQSARQAEASAYFLAGQALASQGLEQARAAKWDLSISPVVDQVVSGNFPTVGQIMDVPGSGSRPIYGTNVTTISTVSSNPPLKMIRVDCAWSLLNGARYTNSVFTYRAPDQFLP
jgi:type II secretory pathway pseudopilin PulG